MTNIRLVIGKGWVPARAKDIEALREGIVVDEASVDGEGSHEDNDVATLEDDSKHLERKWAEPLTALHKVV